jgi:DNA-binding winged helix-turn-helix (wHTH) protein
MPFRFADCELDSVARELRRGGTRVPVQPKVFELLAHLARNGDRLVPREEILRVLWPGVSVTSASASRAIKGARSAIGDDGHSQRLLQTTKKGGVRFVCPVEVDGEDHAAALDRECEARALLALAQDRRRTGHADAADPARRAMGLARAQGLRRTFAEAALVFAGIFDRHRPPDPGLVSALEEALGLLHPDDQDLRARLLARLAAEESFAADGARRESVQREAVALARQRFGEILPLLEADAARRPGPSSRCLLACVLAEAGEVERCRAVLATVVVQDLASLARFGSAPANAAVLARACFVAGCTEPVPVLEAILAPYRDRIVLRGLITAHALLAEARALATRAGVSRWLSELGDDERVI